MDQFLLIQPRYLLIEKLFESQPSCNFLVQGTSAEEWKCFQIRNTLFCAFFHNVLEILQIKT